MFASLRKFLFGNGQSEKERIERVLTQMKADMAAPLPLSDLRPIMIPSSILEGGQWFGPHHYFPSLPVSLTWAFMRPENTMLYLSKDVADNFTAEGIDWLATARQALIQDSEKHSWTMKAHPLDNSRPVAGILHPNSLGPSRLLCYDHLIKLFPHGFQLFVPERWTAFIVSSDAPPDIVTETKKFVAQAHQSGEVPMSLEPYDHLLLKEALVECGEYTPRVV